MTNSPNLLKVALLQQKYTGDKNSMMQSTKDMIEKASKNGAKLVCCMELHTSEYFCQSENTKFFEKADMWESELKYFCDVAKQNKIVLLISLFEKRRSGLYHNTAFVIESDGSVAGKYRKMHIPDDPQFYEKFYFTPGEDERNGGIGFSPIDTSVGRLGVLICWDQWYSESARIMSLKGAEMLIYPTAIGWCDEEDESSKIRNKEAWKAVQRGHAICNGIPVLAINRVGYEKDSSGISEFVGDHGGIEFWGESFAYGPFGELLAQGSDKEEIIYVEIDKSKSEETLRTWPFLRDRRIECYKDILKR